MELGIIELNKIFIMVSIFLEMYCELYLFKVVKIKCLIVLGSNIVICEMVG